MKLSFLENDMLTPKVAKLNFWSEKIRNILKRMQKQFSDFFQSTPCRAAPLEPSYFWIESSNQLIIEYFCIAHLNEVCKNISET